MYDFLIVGAGLYGSVFAHQATIHGKKCLVIDKRNHAGGNTYCENIEGINVHKYGPHVFHTNDHDIWKYVNTLTSFYQYQHNVVANYKGKIYALPFNMHTFNQVWGITDPNEVAAKIKSQAFSGGSGACTTEQHAISMIGKELYYMFVKGYTEKQWGKPVNEIPSSILQRIPVRYTYDNNYFNDIYQGIPVGGYNTITQSLLKGVDVRLNADFFKDENYFRSLAKQVVYTGPIDQYFNYRFGELEYRSLCFEHKVLNIENFQGIPTVNYTELSVPYTRIVEHKHFEKKLKTDKTVITYEYPLSWRRGIEPYYPIQDALNAAKYKKYRDLADLEHNVIFGGRLGRYQYLDMHQVIAMSLKDSKTILNETTKTV